MRRIHLAIGRERGHHDFGADHVDAIRTIAPHLITALHVDERLRQANVSTHGAYGALSQLDFGVVIIDRTLRPVFVNKRAHALANQRDGLLLSTSRISASQADDTRRLHAAILGAIELGAPDGAIPADVDAGTHCFLARRPPHLPLVASVIPVTSAALQDFAGDDAQAALFIIEPDSATAIDPQVLARVFGLTPRETSLAAALAGGLDIEEAARRLGIGIGTARGYLKQLLEKTGTHRQAQLVALLLRSAAGSVRPASGPIAPDPDETAPSGST